MRINHDIIKKSIRHYGKGLIATIAMEECAELIQAISKYKRGKPDRDNMAEEIADVLISIENMKYVAGNWSLVAMYVAWTINCIYGWYNWTKITKANN